MYRKWKGGREAQYLADYKNATVMNINSITYYLQKCDFLN